VRSFVKFEFGTWAFPMALILFVTGPAGTGKTSFCNIFHSYLKDMNKEVYYMNLDPSTTAKIEHIFDLGICIPSAQIMADENLGPNASLVRSLQYFSDNCNDLDIFDLSEKSIVLVDCPGQIELYMHYDLFPKILSQFQTRNNQCLILYLIESHYLNNFEKFVSACASCLVTFSLFSLPQINVISKMDLVCDNSGVDNTTEDHYYEKYKDFFNLDLNAIKEQLNHTNNIKYEGLIQKLTDLIENCGIGEFIPYDTKNFESNEYVFLKICEASNFDFEEEPIEYFDESS
jgi:GPN-loop GTPase